MTCPFGDILAMYAFLVLITLSAGVRLYKECLNVCHVGEKDESRPAAKFIADIQCTLYTQVNVISERQITKISQSELCFDYYWSKRFWVFGLDLPIIKLCNTSISIGTNNGAPFMLSPIGQKIGHINRPGRITFHDLSKLILLS